MERSDLKRWIRLAYDAVQGQPEPYKLEAFKVILSRLIEQGSISEILPEGVIAKKTTTTAARARLQPGRIPEDVLENVSELTNREKIQVQLYYAGRPLTKEEIRRGTKDLGIDDGWWNGSNFKRDMMKRSKLLVEEKAGKGEDPRYRLTSVARASTKNLLERLS
ncbi:MAG: hypothetical protein ACE5JV_02645 [Nitrososphaerales archaeon]